MPEETAHGELWRALIGKRRTVIVVSRDDLRGVRRQTTVAVITRTIRGIPSEVLLDDRDGLSEPSVVNCDVLATIEKSRLKRRIGRLSTSKLEELHEALAFALQLT